MTARCSPPCPARSPWPSPSMLSLRTITGPSTGVLQIPVCTVLPFHATSFGRPTLTDTSLAAMASPSGQRFTTVDLQRNTGQEAVRHGEQHGIGDILCRAD